MERRVKLLQKSLARDLQITRNTLLSNVNEFSRLLQLIAGDLANNNPEVLDHIIKYKALLKSHKVALERFASLERQWKRPDYSWIDWRDVEVDAVADVGSGVIR